MGPCTGWPFRSLQIYAYLVHGVQDGQAELNPDAQSIWKAQTVLSNAKMLRACGPSGDSTSFGGSTWGPRLC